MKIKYSKFTGFDEVKHKDLYDRYSNLKKIKEELAKDGFTVEEKNIFKNTFNRYYFYDSLNKKFEKISELYKKENLEELNEKINNKYHKKINEIVDEGRNKNKVYLFIRLFWSLSFFKEFFVCKAIIIRKNISDAIRKRKKIEE